MLFIENEGALFRGPARSWPREVWLGGEFRPYAGTVPKGIEWGSLIDEDQAKRMMAEKVVGCRKPGSGPPSGGDIPP